MINNKEYTSTCSYCGVGCGVKIKKDEYNRLTLRGDEENPVNKGMLCSKGMTLHYTVMDQSDRLKYPMMRWNRHMPRQRVDWEQGLDRAAAVFKSIINKYGPDSVGFYVSGQCLTEEYYLVNKLAKGLIGTNNIDTNSRLCMSSAAVGYKKTIGEDSVPAGYEDIEHADCFFIAGANPAWCHPILFRRLEKRKEENPDVKFIVVDPRKTQSCAMADLHLQLIPGTDVYLYLAIGRLLVEKGYADQEFIKNHVSGYDEYHESIMNLSVAEAAEQCGVPQEDIEKAADIIGKSKGFMPMWTMGLNQSVIGTNKNLALISLSLITGRIGTPGNGPFSLTGQPNAMGGREVGGMSNLMSAHRDMANPDDRQEIADFWDVPAVPSKPGLTATEMFEALADGRMKAIWIICTNPLVSLPDSRMVEKALEKAKFVVVQDISSSSETVNYADLVLPAAGFMEKEGTMTNSERRISHLEKVLDPPGEALPDSEILWRFARKMGFEKHFPYKKAEEVYREHVQSTKGTNIDISGLNYEILKEHHTVQWPFPEGAKEGTKRLFEDHRFFTSDEKAHLYGLSPHNESEELSPDYPMILTTGRIRDQWHTMTRTGKVAKLNQHISEPFLEIHPDDAAEKDIREDDVVRIFNQRGEVQVKAKVTADIRRGVVFLPMHFGKKLGKDLGRANNVTKTLVDPVSKEPDFKFSAVNVVKYTKARQKVVIIGAGAAALQFVRSYREKNDRDELSVFSSEPIPFYNRVMLPDYISGEKDWKHLLKTSPEEELGCKVYAETAITKIDRKNRVVVDSNGITHSFDILIMATGSRAFLPPQFNKKLEGIYTLRNRYDADNIKSQAQKEGRAIIVGGGLLGIELADALTKNGIEVTMIQRSSRLMERQLDETGSKILDDELKKRGIQILYNDEVKSLSEKEEQLEGIQLKSGRHLPVGVLVFAVGTRPNIQLAKDAGVKTARGVIVNDVFQSSDPNIYALGEIAEHNQQLYGITAAAEEQADLLVRYLNGDPTVEYKGSLSMNILKVEGLELCSIGMIEKPDDSDLYEEVIFMDKARNYYKKCLIYQDQMIGCILIGDKNEFLEYRDLIKHGNELGDKRTKILYGGGESRQVLGKLVCSCNAVGDENIRQAIRDGVHEMPEICQKTGAGTGCGSCRPEVKAILDDELVTETT